MHLKLTLVSVKARFFYVLQSTIAEVSNLEQLIICGDRNGHIRSNFTAFEKMNGGQALGERNPKEDRLLKFAVANELMFGNSWFKRFERLVHTSQKTARPKSTIL